MSNVPEVALESTIIAHGMPYPQNVETALEVESIVREAGAVPKTIGILNGQIIVGMSPGQIEQMGNSKSVWKACERDIALAVARKADAAVTAGASIALAARSGIRVFVTGGIGAVGPSAGRDFDISADLPAIAQYPVLTVCAGAKAFMDIAATLEWLETHRVPVAVWRSDDFPMFYSRTSGIAGPWRVDSAEEIARAFAVRRRMAFDGGMLLAVPLPEDDSMPELTVKHAVATAVEQARVEGVSGKALTPFLLGRIREITGGRSLQSNIALIKNNARVGAEVAVALAKELSPAP